MTNLEAAARAIRDTGDAYYRLGDSISAYTRVALDAIDTRLADLTPEDTRALLDLIVWYGNGGHAEPVPHIPLAAWEVLSR